MDMRTGKYLAKRENAMPGVANKESIAIIDSEGHITEKNCDFLLPVSTKFYDMRKDGTNACFWNEEFIINEHASYICNPNVVILFEILECNETLILQNDKRLNADMLLPVAWGYLRPLGKAAIHLSRNRI